MGFDPMARALAALNKFASSELVHKLGWYQPAQKIAYRASREGFRAASTVGRQFKAVQKLVSPQRLRTPERKSDLFDLTLNEEQQLTRDMAQRFAAEVVREAAARANEACTAPAGFAEQFAELGLGQLLVPESLGGAAT